MKEVVKGHQNFNLTKEGINHLIKLLKVIWVLSSIAVLVLTIVHYEPDSVTDIGIFLVYGMLFLAFPFSLAVAGYLR